MIKDLWHPKTVIAGKHSTISIQRLPNPAPLGQMRRKLPVLNYYPILDHFRLRHSRTLSIIDDRLMHDGHTKSAECQLVLVANLSMKIIGRIGR